MNKLTASSDSVAAVIEDPTVCPRCGATTRLDHGTCINCLLREGLEAKGEASRETFESILTEADVTDTQWRLGHYEILEEIGRGGMGVIYRARQQHSRRIVAVKRVLAHDANSHDTLVRFRREAEAVASLDHPNILPIHEVSESEEGLPFFSMKYAEGGSLRAVAPALRSKPRECVRLMAKVARGIAYAHGKGVLHRDLQPGNILLDENREPMVSDFGLAKWLDQSSDLTRTLETLGTPGYIAPEQAECRATDLTGAADIYSLGAILFYLLAGRPPFVGPNVLFVIHQAAATAAPRLRSLAPSLDRDLETIVARCLQSDPKARYKSAGALAEDLEHWLRREPIRARRTGVFTRGSKWVRRNPTSTVLVALLVAFGGAIGVMFWEKESARPPQPIAISDKSIAVLPFENLSEDKANAYLAVGIQDEILTRLAKIGALKVIARTSTQSYQSKNGNLGQIAKQLGVANILEGSIQKSAGRVHINLQLIRAATGEHLWAETYDRKSDNIFDLQGEVAAAVAQALQAKLTGAEQAALRQRPTDNPDAYDAYLRGIVYSERPGWDVGNVLEAMRSFRKAVTLDSAFALAWARLAGIAGVACRNQYAEKGGDFHRTCEEVKGAADKAMSLQPDLAESNLAQGSWHLYGKRDYDAAISWFEKAHQLSPNSSLALGALAAIYRRKGDCQRSLEYYGRALEFDPRNANLLLDQGRTLTTVRHYPEALKTLDKVLDMTPSDDFALAWRVHIYQCQGDLPAAAALLAPLQPVQRPGDDVFAVQRIQWLYERRYADAIAALTQALRRPDLAAGGSFWVPSQIEGNLAWFLELSGDSKAARSRWENVRSKGEELRKQGHFSVHLRWLATANLALGEKDKAFAIGREMAASESMDAMITVNIERMICELTLQSGDKESALAQLARLVALPYGSYSMPFGVSLVGVSYGDLKFNPLWDPLRGDPRFEKLIEEVKKPVALESPPPVPAGIAVLPFENLSADPDNAFFADGVQDEILNNLARIADLKVISRTSVMQYKSGAKRNLRQIANELGVAHVVEGSVQRASNRVRVSAQLIDAKTDTHLWAESYDRPLGDVFAIQSEVAKAIANQLKAKLSPSQWNALAAAPTHDMEAYDLFLRGESTDWGSPDRAATFYQRALARDPSFAIAYARLANSRLQRHWYISPLTATQLQEVKSNIDRALTLAPDSPDTHLAAAEFYYRGHRDYDSALRELDRTIELQPNNARAIFWRGVIYRRRGEWRRSLAEFERGAELNPRDCSSYAEIGCNLLEFRRWSDAEHALTHALALDPHNRLAALYLASTYINSTGDIRRARQAWEEVPGDNKMPIGTFGASIATMIEGRVYLDVLEKHFADALKAWATVPTNIPDSDARLRQLEARVGIQVIAGQNAVARPECEQTRVLLEAQVAERAEEDRTALSALAWVYVCLGRNADALRVAQQAADSLPIERDALSGPALLVGLAQIEAHAGRPEAAVKILRQLLVFPAGVEISIARLKIDPVWDPIRNDPGFQKLLSEAEPETVYK